MKIVKIIIGLMILVFLCSCGINHSNDNVTNQYSSKEPLKEDYKFAKDIALKVIDYLDKENIEDFKELLSDSIITQDDLDEQIEVLFNFCENGNVTSKDITTEYGASHYEYNHYSFKSVKVTIEDAIVLDDECYNIDFYYVLTDEDNKRNIGLSKLLIRDETGSIIFRFFENPKY